MAVFKQRLEQKLQQKLSPQQIQLIKLLEVPIVELENRIKKELEENPVLEEGEPLDNEEEIFSPDDNEEIIDNEKEDLEEPSFEDEFSPEELMPEDDDIPLYKLTVNNYSADSDEREIPYAEQASFQEFMKQQLVLSDIPEDKKIMAEYIIGNIDESGYLKRDLDLIVSDLALQYGISTTLEEVEEVLKEIQKFDPPGVGARSLQECLAIQLRRKLEERPDDENLKLALKIVEEHFNEFAKKHYDKLLSRLSIDKEQLKNAIDEILKLNPKPGNFYQTQPARRNVQQITPDFVLQNVDGKLLLQLNSGNVPPLRISREYSDMLKKYQVKGKKDGVKEDKETASFIKQKIDSAKWFIDAIKQREDTLYRTMKAIIDYQEDFFRTGDETKLRPMILKDIAEKTDLDISTISRVANSKYIQTPFGIFPLKYFFSEGMETEDGKEVSTREIKKILKDAIEKEDKRKPLTDEKLAKILQEKGYKIARRTVAKYREQMGIPVARLRKEL